MLSVPFLPHASWTNPSKKMTSSYLSVCRCHFSTQLPRQRFQERAHLKAFFLLPILSCKNYHRFLTNRHHYFLYNSARTFQSFYTSLWVIGNRRKKDSEWCHRKVYNSFRWWSYGWRPCFGWEWRLGSTHHYSFRTVLTWLEACSMWYLSGCLYTICRVSSS